MITFSGGSHSPSEMKNRGQSYEGSDGNNGERRGDKKAGDYLFLLPFSPSPHIALQGGMDLNIS